MRALSVKSHMILALWNEHKTKHNYFCQYVFISKIFILKRSYSKNFMHAHDTRLNTRHSWPVLTIFAHYIIHYSAKLVKNKFILNSKSTDWYNNCLISKNQISKWSSTKIKIKKASTVVFFFFWGAVLFRAVLQPLPCNLSTCKRHRDMPLLRFSLIQTHLVRVRFNPLGPEFCNV